MVKGQKERYQVIKLLIKPGADIFKGAKINVAKFPGWFSTF